MITHVVLMKFKAEKCAEHQEEARARLTSMVGRVPSLRALEVGLHVGPAAARAMDLALVTRFDDLAGLAAYADHPVHVEVKRWLGEVLEASYVVDFAGDPPA